MNQTMEAIFPLLYSTCEIVPIIQSQVKKCNSSFSLSLSTKGAPKMQLQVKQEKGDTTGDFSGVHIKKKCIL